METTLADRETAVEEREKVLQERSSARGAARDDLQHQRGGLLTEAQSRCILLNYFELQQRGSGEKQSVRESEDPESGREQGPPREW